MVLYFFSFVCVCFAEQESNKRESIMESALEELSSAQEDAASDSIICDGRKWEISESFHYERSKFESTNLGAEIKLFEVDTAIKRCFKKGSLTLTIPYIYQKDAVRITRSLLRTGQVVRISRENQRSAEGLGDFTLDSVLYVLTEDEKYPVDLMFYGYVKFPTVDKDHGFGTDEYDVGPGLGLSKRLFERWLISGDVYYTFIGDPPEQDLRNELKFDGGLAYDLTSKVTLSVTYEQSNALVKQSKSNYEDILAGINYMLNDSVSFFGEKTFELNNDYLEESITFGIAVRF